PARVVSADVHSRPRAHVLDVVEHLDHAFVVDLTLPLASLIRLFFRHEISPRELPTNQDFGPSVGPVWQARYYHKNPARFYARKGEKTTRRRDEIPNKIAVANALRRRVPSC